MNLSDTHRKIVQAVYELSLLTQFASNGFSATKIADEAGISKSTVSKNRAYLTMSVNLLYETEDKKLAISEDADPSWWAESNPMEGFPTPSEVHSWEGGPPPPPNLGNGGNKETAEGSSDTYTENSVSSPGNGEETAETPTPRLTANGRAVRLTMEQVETYKRLKANGFSAEEARQMAREESDYIEI